jgi:hypothetical protein
MLSAEEFENKLKDLRNHGSTETVGQMGSSLDTIELVAEDNSRGENLKCFSVDLDKYPGNVLTVEQVKDIIADMSFVTLPEKTLNTFLEWNMHKTEFYEEFFKWIVIYTNESLWDCSKISIRDGDSMVEFLILSDCKSITEVPTTLREDDKIVIQGMNSDVCVCEILNGNDKVRAKTVYYVLHTNVNLYDGLRDIPYYAKFYSGMVLKDCKVYSSFVASDENDYILMIDGKVTIITGNPIVAYDHVKISGVPGSKLTLIGMSRGQPCIGTVTNTGLSYGRWEPPIRCTKEIVVENVTVECQSNDAAFSIGAYDWEEVPKIVCINGGRLICPETEGTRVLRKHGTCPNGSTKRISYPVYEIVKTGDTPLNSLSAECKSILHEIDDIVTGYDKYVTYKTTEKCLEMALELLKINNSLDVSTIIAGVPETQLFMYRSASILRMPKEYVHTREEFAFELSKLDWVAAKFYGTTGEGCSKYNWNLMYFLKEKFEWNEYLMNVLYELIPSYDHNFTGLKGSDVDAYLLYGNEFYYDEWVQDYLGKSIENIEEHFHL